jgi:hypothetical protein
MIWWFAQGDIPDIEALDSDLHRKQVCPRIQPIIMESVQDTPSLNPVWLILKLGCLSRPNHNMGKSDGGNKTENLLSCVDPRSDAESRDPLLTHQPLVSSDGTWCVK